MTEAEWHWVMRGEDRSLKAGALRAVMATLEPGYAAVTRARNAMFDAGLRRPTRLPRPTISVGNLTTGGTGKTPMVMHIARRLRAAGVEPAVLTRGYRGGDEAAMMRRELPGVSVAVDPDRVAGAAAALRGDAQVGAFVLDDGFQRRQVARDLDLVLIDATLPFGYGRLLPRGLLRESKGSLQRADAVVVTRCGHLEHEARSRLDAEIAELAGRSPIAHVDFAWLGFRDHDDREWPSEALAATPVVSAQGIGNPSAFVDMVSKHVGGHAVVNFSFPDHHAYTRAELDEVFAKAQQQGAAAVLTTEKDWVKWEPLLAWPPPLPVYRAVLGPRFLDGEALLDAMLRDAVARYGGKTQS